jgi:hypothetical protein
MLVDLLAFPSSEIPQELAPAFFAFLKAAVTVELRKLGSIEA